MLWSDLLITLDATRAQIRSGKKLKEEVDLSDPILNVLLDALTGGVPVPVIDAAVLEAPEPKAVEPSAPIIVESVDRGAGEGRMLVFAREPKAPRKPPVLEEVFDEKDLG